MRGQHRLDAALAVCPQRRLYPRHINRGGFAEIQHLNLDPDARIEQADRMTKAPRKVFDTIADNAANAAIILGGRPMRPDAVDWRWAGALLFKNAGTGKHNMVYRRGDGSIGWVEPS